MNISKHAPLTCNPFKGKTEEEVSELNIYHFIRFVICDIVSSHGTDIRAWSLFEINFRK